MITLNQLRLDARQNIRNEAIWRQRPVTGPVCGTDDRTYFTERELYEHNCRTGEDVQILYKGVCDRYCGYIRPLYSPVCGTDGITYKNEDHLDYQNCMNKFKSNVRQNNPLAVAYWGPCQDECGPVDPTIDEVCGSDGRFYSNTDAIRAYNCANGLRGYEKVTIAEDESLCWGRCIFDDTRSYDDEYGPRCGSDGKTYYLIKELAEYNCRERLKGRHEVKIIHRGYCTTDCPNALRFWDPVCGCDGRTYDNEYVLDEMNCINEGTVSDFVSASVSYKGKCDDDCHDSTKQGRVCGTDGITYKNKKDLDYQNCINKYYNIKKIRIARTDKCYSFRQNYWD